MLWFTCWLTVLQTAMIEAWGGTPRRDLSPLEVESRAGLQVIGSSALKGDC